MARSSEASKRNKDIKSTAASLTKGIGGKLSTDHRCRSVSRWCLKSSAMEHRTIYTHIAQKPPQKWYGLSQSEP